MSTGFLFLANDLSLDFVNTRIRNRGKEIDLVDTAERMAAWFEVAGFSTEASQWAASDLAAAASLRTAIHSVMLSVLEGSPPQENAVERINRHLSQYDPNKQVVRDDNTFRLVDREQVLSPSKALGLLAERASRLITSEDRARIRACSHPECILLFKDTSKSGKRRWCSMQTCGNRSKATTFRANAERTDVPS